MEGLRVLAEDTDFRFKVNAELRFDARGDLIHQIKDLFGGVILEKQF